jgi:hypothetical protein
MNSLLYSAPATFCDTSLNSVQCYIIIILLLSLQVSLLTYRAFDESRTSALAQSTVLRMTMLSRGNIEFLGIYQTETCKSIKMKVCMIDYVGKSI